MDLNEFYIRRIAQIEEVVAGLQEKKKRFGWTRLTIFIVTVISFFVILNYNGIAAASTAIVLLLIFLYVAGKDIDNTKRLNFQKRLLQINEDELKATRHDFSTFEDGASYLSPSHPYANDLDIFGPHSLFQFINRTASYPGGKKLAAWLLEPADEATIQERQDAVKELKEAIDWRQKLLATGKTSPITGEIFSRLNDWIASEDEDPRKDIRNILVILFPLITLAFIVAASLNYVSWNILWLSFCAHLLLLWRVEKKNGPAYEKLSESVDALDAFYNVTGCIAEKKFNAARLKQLQAACQAGNRPAFEALKRLKKILDRMHLRLNPLLHFPVNLAVFWDWYLYKQLVFWRTANKKTFAVWLEAYAELEVLSSFANMAFNHPQWCTPTIEKSYFRLSATALGHPLLADEKRVCNEVTFDGTGKILLITGSNMAGKSTFLRTVGVNIILAMAGSVTCAEEMTISATKVISSMRIADNLEENISTFYAELKKLETVLQKVRQHERVFILLDEILRGTNSLDRHAGARALIKEFLTEGAIGILATHDLALTEMGEEHPGQVINYHFDVQVHGDELFFDYKLKPGICTSMNASLLMRKIGINV